MLRWILFSLCVVCCARPLERVANERENWLQICCQENDKNMDGAISFREFKPFVLEVLDMNQQELSRVFLTADQDKNSDLDGSECPVVRQLLRETMRKRVKEAIKKYDTNQDGHLTHEEAQILAKNQFGVTLTSTDSAFRFSDGNGDAVTNLLLRLRAKALREQRVKPARG